MPSLIAVRTPAVLTLRVVFVFVLVFTFNIITVLARFFPAVIQRSFDLLLSNNTTTKIICQPKSLKVLPIARVEKPQLGS